MLAGVPFVATVHGKNYFWEKLRRRVVYRLVSRHGTLIAVSKDLKQFICDKVGIPEKRVEVIYNGVTPAQTYRRMKRFRNARLSWKSQGAILCWGLWAVSIR